MIDFYKMLGSKVKITDRYGKVTVGRLISYEVGAMEDIDYDTVGIQTEEGEQSGYYEGVPVPDIASCEVIED
jgi:hypothetical protein